MWYNGRMKLGLAVIIFGIILFLGVSFFIEPESVEVEPKQFIEESSQQTKEEKISIILVGDIMLDRGVEYMVEKYGDGDFRFPFLKIANYLKTADIVFGNLEGPISDKGEKVGSIYSFRAEPESIEGLKFSDFDILSLANNHAFDYGRKALEDTFLRLKTAGIDYLGAGLDATEAYSGIIKEIDGVKIGFMAYTNLGPENWKATENNSGITWISEGAFEKVKNDIKVAKENSDILIVSLHSGEEYQKEPTKFQIEFSKMATDAGADLVVGHHPHVVQPMEKYKEGYIAYSLGNFVFDQSFSEETMKGQIVEVLIENKEIKEAIPIEIEINEYFQPATSSTLRY